MHQISKIYFVIKLHMFRASSVPIIRSYLLYTRELVRFMQVLWPLPSWVRLERSSNLTLLGSGHITCMKRTNSRVYSTVDNSWWWAQKMPETCGVLWQNKFWIFDASSWLFYTKLVTIHGHLNTKQLFCVVFCAVRAVHRFDFRLVINEGRNLLHALIQTHVVDRIYMFSPDSRLEW